MSHTIQTLKQILGNRILILVGAMGTMVQRHRLEEADFRGDRYKDHPVNLKGNNDILVLTRPDIITQIHSDYLNAGADIIETSTFNATSISQSGYKMEAFIKDINLEGARLARRIADEFTKRNPGKPRFVAGCIGPTNRITSISPDVNNPAFRVVTFDEMVASYFEQVEWLIEGGVDILLVETIFDTLNAKSALFAIGKLFEKRNIKLPVMVSGTITDASGRTLSGQTLGAFIASVSHFPLLSIGLNCALGAKQLLPHIEELSSATSFFPDFGNFQQRIL